jgi:hypothetical protein
MMVVNATHPSVAFLLRNTTGATWLISQPLTANGPPPYNGGATEVDTWAGEDSVSIYNLVQVNLVQFQPVLTFTGASSTFSSGTLERVNVWDPGGLYAGLVYLNTARIGAAVNVVESVAQRQLLFEGVQSAANFNTSENSTLLGGVLGCPVSPLSSSTSFSLRCAFLGGTISNAAGGFQSQIAGALLDDDVVVGAALRGSSLGTGAIGTLYVDTLSSLWVQGPANLNPFATGSGSNIIYGPGTLNAFGRVTYPSGAGAAAAAFKITTLQINSQTLACKAQPGAGGITTTCNLSLNAALLDTNAGATSGCTFLPAGGSFCNFGP